MKAISNFFSIAILATFVENMLFKHSLGLAGEFGYSKKLDHTNTLWNGALSTVLIVVASFPLHVASRVLSNYKYSFVYIPLVYTFLITATYFAAIVISKEYLPMIYHKIIKHIPISTYNAALIGGYILSQSNMYTKMYQTVAFCFGSAIGYTIATMLVVEGARKISISDVPRPFKGIPVMMIYIGLLSLVFFGISREFIG